MKQIQTMDSECILVSSHLVVPFYMPDFKVGQYIDQWLGNNRASSLEDSVKKVKELFNKRMKDIPRVTLRLKKTGLNA